MKKTKFLSLLVFAPLLASCGAGKFDEPKFAKYGDEVKAEKFGKAFDDILKKSSLNKKAKLGSLFMSKRDVYYSSSDVVRNKKSIKGGSMGQAEVSEISYDSKNVIAKNVETDEYVQKEYALSGEEVAETSMKSTNQQQVSKVKGKSSLVSIDEDTKTYSVIYEVDKDNVPANDFDAQFKSYLSGQIESSYVTFALSYEAADAKEKKNYKFYQNGNVFTMEFQDSQEVEEENYKGSSSEKWTIQLDLTEGKWNLKSLYVHEAEVEVTKDYYQGSNKFIKGDILKEKEMSIEDAKAEQKDIKLNALDLANYDLEA